MEDPLVEEIRFDCELDMYVRAFGREAMCFVLGGRHNVPKAAFGLDFVTADTGLGGHKYSDRIVAEGIRVA